MPRKNHPSRATLIRVQELHDAGNSFRKIAEILAAEGVPAAGTRSKWHHDSVRGCLEQIEQRSESSATWGLSPQIRARLAAQGEEIEGLTVAGVQRLGTGIQETVETGIAGDRAGGGGTDHEGHCGIKDDPGRGGGTDHEGQGGIKDDPGRGGTAGRACAGGPWGGCRSGSLGRPWRSGWGWPGWPGRRGSGWKAA